MMLLYILTALAAILFVVGLIYGVGRLISLKAVQADRDRLQRVLDRITAQVDDELVINEHNLLALSIRRNLAQGKVLDNL